jgi:hypothetical protein
MVAQHTRGERREGGPVGRQHARSGKVGGNSVTLLRKVEAGEVRVEGVRYNMGCSGPVALG